MQSRKVQAITHTHTHTHTLCPWCAFQWRCHDWRLSQHALDLGTPCTPYLSWARPALHTYLGHALHSIPILGTPCTPVGHALHSSWARPALHTYLGHALHSIPILGTPCTPLGHALHSIPICCGPVRTREVPLPRLSQLSSLQHPLVH